MVKLSDIEYQAILDNEKRAVNELGRLRAELAEARKDGERLKKVLYVLATYKGSALGCNPQILFTAISDAARGEK